VSADPGVFRKKIESVDLLGKDKKELVSTFAEGGAAGWLSENKAIVVRDDVLYLVDLNGDTQKQLSELRINTHNANDPVVSPDGKKVVFVEEGTHNLWLLNMEENSSYLLTDRFINIIWGLDWSWDSQRVAFSSSHGEITIIHIANADRTAETRIILKPGRFSPCSLSLTPEGNVLFVNMGDRVYVVNADGTGLHSITEKIDLTLFRLSPDASKLAINKCPVPDNCGLYIMDLAGR
jgi:Tol biopolymer transport system component